MKELPDLIDTIIVGIAQHLDTLSSPEQFKFMFDLFGKRGIEVMSFIFYTRKLLHFKGIE